MEAEPTADLHALSALTNLDDSVRRRLYQHVAGGDEPVTRDDAAGAVGISRSLAAYHLDKLAEAGLLATSYARPPGRGGPGAGRPAKRYWRTHDELAVTLPPRNYTLLAALMTEAMGADQTGVVRDAVNSAAREAGRIAGGADTLVNALDTGGYQPRRTDRGTIELRNCPFHRLARQHTELVCGLNLAWMTGLLEATGNRGQHTELRPDPARCCVIVHDPDPELDPGLGSEPGERA